MLSSFRSIRQILCTLSSLGETSTPRFASILLGTASLMIYMNAYNAPETTTPSSASANTSMFSNPLPCILSQSLATRFRITYPFAWGLTSLRCLLTNVGHSCSVALTRRFHFDGRLLLFSKVSLTRTMPTVAHLLGTIFGEYYFIIFNIFQSISLVLLVIIVIIEVAKFFADWKERH